MRISDWSSDVCSSDLDLLETARVVVLAEALAGQGRLSDEIAVLTAHLQDDRFTEVMQQLIHQRGRLADLKAARGNVDRLVADIFALLRVAPDETGDGLKIGTRSCRERVCQSV